MYMNPSRKDDDCQEKQLKRRQRVRVMRIACLHDFIDGPLGETIPASRYGVLFTAFGGAACQLMRQVEIMARTVAFEPCKSPDYMRFEFSRRMMGLAPAIVGMVVCPDFDPDDLIRLGRRMSRWRKQLDYGTLICIAWVLGADGIQEKWRVEHAIREALEGTHVIVISEYAAESEERAVSYSIISFLPSIIRDSIVAVGLDDLIHFTSNRNGFGGVVLMDERPRPFPKGSSIWAMFMGRQKDLPIEDIEESSRNLGELARDPKSDCKWSLVELGSSTGKLLDRRLVKVATWML